MNSFPDRNIAPAKTESLEKVIEINNLRKEFGTQEVFKNVTLQLFMVKTW